MSEVPALTLAVLCAFGGTMGYIKSGSIPSIAAGLSVGGLYAFAGTRIRAGQGYGLETAVLASLVLGGSSIPRAIRTGKGLPIGLSALAVFGLVYYGSKVRQGR